MAQDVRPWSSLTLEEVRRDVEASGSGLSSAEVLKRQERYGRNLLPQQAQPAIWQIFLRQFQSPLIYILGVAAVVSMVAHEVTDAAFIGVVLLVNALIGGYQEWRAQQSSQALQKLLQIHATVERDGKAVDLLAEELVPGDKVWLESGNRVPADVRLVAGQGLEVDESLLTGESQAAHKDAGWSGEAGVPLGDQHNMAFAGSIVARGRAEGIVVATGLATQVGQLAATVISAEGGKTPLLERMESFTRQIAIVVLATCVVVGLLGVVIRGETLTSMFMLGVALAVAAIPESLPIVMTVTLSIATSRMAKRGVIVRSLTAVEGLGSCTLVATDKTGTLTVNAMTIRKLVLADGNEFEVTGEGFIPEGEVQQDGQTAHPEQLPRLRELALAGVLCNEADLHEHAGEWTWRGDAVDVAFLALGRKLGQEPAALLEQFPLVNEIPFESEHQFAATYHTGEGGPRVFVKGGPERVLGMCALSEPERAEFHRHAERLARDGFRVLALAAGAAPDVQSGTTPAEPVGLQLLGLAGMIDPLRVGARQAVLDCHSAGVAVSMVTGDHQVTALAIARELGLAEDESQVMTGQKLATLSPTELGQAVETTRVFARVSPQQKLQIVEAARAAGHFVAVTGDGVNDAPALRAANIGVAMGQAGTDVAREAARLVISDDNFATIVAGIEEGRIAYDNLRKVIYLLISTGAAELVVVALAVAAGLPLPLLPVQLLWLNLVTNGIQDVALAFEPGEGDSLKRKPRPPAEPIFNRLMIERTVLGAVVMGVVGFAMYWWAIRAGWSEFSARNALLLLMVLFENFHIGNCRSETRSAFQLSPLRSPILLTGTISVFLLHVVMMHTQWGQQVLKTEPVSLQVWAVLAMLASTILIALEIHKWTWNRRFPVDRVEAA